MQERAKKYRFVRQPGTRRRNALQEGPAGAGGAAGEPLAQTPDIHSGMKARKPAAAGPWPGPDRPALVRTYSPDKKKMRGSNLKMRASFFHARTSIVECHIF